MGSIMIREWGSIGTEKVWRIDLSQPNGMSVSCINYGARLIRLLVPDREGRRENVVLGLADAEAYGNDRASFGATVGPVAGRITGGKWGTEQLEQNNGVHHIHGGSRGWGQQFWDFKTEETAAAVTVTFTLDSTPETVGYPGRLQAKTSYTLDAEGCLTITMEGISQDNEETLFNPTSHIYFNLSGDAKRPITEHTLQLACEEVLELDADKLPTGTKQNVAGTAFDFREATVLGDAIRQRPEGFDDVFLMKPDQQPQLILKDETSGRQMELSSNRSSIVLFSTTGMNEPYLVNGRPMRSQLGLAIEAQEVPDAIHHPGWDNIVLAPNTLAARVQNYTFKW
ncbi:aldose epimerase family protein [Trichococcus pasteurii]|uniref:Aldose 1-epimerase n=1 Tax=Trichococcus pasteurii TaxID=43064 RepID=A0A1W1IIF3_9LACT|nr:aldose epimerase family protein [Trichococcus pasteurii]SFE94530.1 aldose 1-epimerase [Trichococcus pasteurii]SLM52766.1 aldose 1-/glucose-6-phosphate 1-epimerase [Trichococcus pasteurii]SSB93647.1 aldose 1-/glucose-6-phosphate 1-epimerase [Trichococcus pasteurii]